MNESNDGAVTSASYAYGWYPSAENFLSSNGSTFGRPTSIISLNPDAPPFVPTNMNYVQYPVSSYSNCHGGGSNTRHRGSISNSNDFPQRQKYSQEQNNGLQKKELDNQDSLREKLASGLSSGSYECTVCFESVQRFDQIWSCSNCFHVLHLHCIRKWANTAVHQQAVRDQAFFDGWVCPHCRQVTQQIPTEYRCFCGKYRNPRGRFPDDLPHSCGNICEKKNNGSCPHKCVLSCHPGPCPPCPKTVTVSCLCGKTEKTVRCGKDDVIQCSDPCDKLLSCGVHKCDQTCHAPPCTPCQVQLQQFCYCSSKKTRFVVCTSDTAISTESIPVEGENDISKTHLLNQIDQSTGSFSCSSPCNNLYPCGLHRCSRPCHQGNCDPACPFSPPRPSHCPCGRKRVAELLNEDGQGRTKCTDPVPCCEGVCAKRLGCGPEDEPHCCKDRCHSGPCKPCDLVTPVPCRCDSILKPIPCQELPFIDDSNPVLCDRKCNRKKSCKRHKCQEVCCVQEVHLCTVICGKTLECGMHACEALCHSGKCAPCLQASFEELHCECGTETLFPPVACGAEPPACGRPCSRDHSCPHPVWHNCHSEPECPPCTALTSKPCFGKHEVRNNIPCHLESVSCGRRCNVMLTCGHRCPKLCHNHDQPDATVAQTGGALVVEECQQLCATVREPCGHPCGLKCHAGTECPAIPCKFVMQPTCSCGNNKQQMRCFEVDKLVANQRRSKLIADQFASLSSTIQLAAVEESIDREKCLPCVDECERMKRNRKWAEALNIQDADLGGEIEAIPTYTDYMRQQLEKSPQFVMQLEKVLVGLVESAVDSGKRSHVFPPMNRDQRRMVHEYAEYFNVETHSYDAEPKRNIVIVAKKNVSRLPTKLLSSFMNSTNNKLKNLKIAAPITMAEQSSLAEENLAMENLLR